MQQEPVAQDLGHDGHEHEADHEAAAAPAAQHGQPAPQLAPLAEREAAQPGPARAIAGIPASGTHQGRPSGPTSVNDVSTASAASTARIGTSAVTSVGTCGATSGEDRRSAAIRAATPRWPLTTLPSTWTLDAR